VHRKNFWFIFSLLNRTNKTCIFFRASVPLMFTVDFTWFSRIGLSEKGSEIYFQASEKTVGVTCRSTQLWLNCKRSQWRSAGNAWQCSRPARIQTSNVVVQVTATSTSWRRVSAFHTRCRCASIWLVRITVLSSRNIRTLPSPPKRLSIAWISEIWRAETWQASIC